MLQSFSRIEGIKIDCGLSDLTVPGVCVYKERQPKKDKNLLPLLP